MFFHKKSNGISWLVVFLGNPGVKYSGTRHNVGFMTADVAEKEKNVKISRLKYKALTAVCDIAGRQTLLMKPQTYMNLSGESVWPAAQFYKIPPERILVISDDVSMPTGKLRIRTKGSAGGHNGLKSIIGALGTDAFPRIKIGVGAPPHPDYDMADWVLGTFKDKDAEEISEAVRRAFEAVEAYIAEGPERAMNRFN
ncbi:MAG: aminoacyl-tRNA hydrolase [Oscillospiraceae bacterium]